MLQDVPLVTCVNVTEFNEILIDTLWDFLQIGIRFGTNEYKKCWANDYQI